MANGGARRTIATELTLNVSGYVNNVRKAERETRQFESAVTRGARNASSEFTGAGNAVRNVGVVAAGVLASGVFVKMAQSAKQAIADSVEAASDLNESVNAVEVTFGRASRGVFALGETADESMGLSQRAFNEAAVQMSNFAGIVAGEGGNVVNVVEDMTQRASDFASVMNLEVEESLRLFQSGLAGETEPLRRYGIDLSAAAVQAHALAEGIAESGSEMTEAEKVQARYDLLMQQTAKTQGDFANTSDDAANAQRIFNAQLENFQANAGQALLPLLSSLIGFGSDLIAGFEALPGPLQAVVGIIAAAAALTPGVLALRTAMISLGLSIRGVLLATGPAGAVFVALGAALAALGASSDKTSEQQKSLEESMKAVARAAEDERRAIAASEIQKSDIIDTARSLGVSLGELTDVFLDQGGTADELRSRLEGIANEYELLPGPMGRTKKEFTEEALEAQKLLGWLDDTETASRDLASEQRELALATGETAGAVEQAASVISEDAQEMSEGWGESIEKMIDANDALSAANAELEEDQELTTQAFLDELAKRVEIAQRHNENITAIQRRASEDVREQLLADAQDNPELAQLMVDATAEEWARMEEIYRQETELATEASRDALIRATPELTRVAEDIGQETARGLARKLEEGGHLSVTEARKIYNNIDAEFHDDIAATIRPVMDEFNYSRVLGEIGNLTAPRTLWVTPSLTDSSIRITGPGFSGRVADGGWVGYASGGGVFGPFDGRPGGQITAGTGPRADDVMILASRGEFVVNADSAARNRQLLEAINMSKGTAQKINNPPMPAFQSGGSVGTGTISPVVNMPREMVVRDVNGEFIGRMRVEAQNVISEGNRFERRRRRSNSGRFL